MWLLWFDLCIYTETCSFIQSRCPHFFALCLLRVALIFLVFLFWVLYASHLHSLDNLHFVSPVTSYHFNIISCRIVSFLTVNKGAHNPKRSSFLLCNFQISLPNLQFGFSPPKTKPTLLKLWISSMKHFIIISIQTGKRVVNSDLVIDPVISLCCGPINSHCGF